MAGLDIGHRLVHEPLARHVDDDRPRRIALGQREPRRADQRHRRTPPGVFHQFQCGAQLFGRQNPVTGVRLGAHGPLGGDGRALVFHPHLLVVLEAAAGQDHTAARPDQPRFGGLGRLTVTDIDPAHHAVFEVQVGQRGVEHHRNAGPLQTDAQRPDQRPAHADQVLAGRLGPHGAGADLQAAQHTPRVALELVQPHVVLLHDNDVQRHLAVRRFQAGLVGPQFAGVERLRLDRPALRASARRLRVVVGVPRHPAHLQRRVLEHEGQHFRPAFQVGVDAFRLDDVADDPVQIGAGCLRGVLHPITLEHFVIWDPNTAARPRGRAAEVGAFSMTMVERPR